MTRELPPIRGPSAQLERGEQMGWFNMGSTVIVLFPKDRVRWLPSLAAGMPVRVGQPLGRLLPPP
jgi:phosphatidylserine decarboxylase